MKTAESIALDTSLDLDALQAVLREHPVRLAILFGSHATETTHATSDIDLAVEFDEHRPSEPSYNDVFLGVSADLSDALETDDVDYRRPPYGLATTRSSDLRERSPPRR